MFSMFWSFAVRPAIRTAGSPPGTTMKIRKTKKLTTISTSTIPMIRRAMNVAISGRPPSVLDPHFRARVEGIPEAVAEDVQREHRHHDREAGRQCQPRRGRDPRLA